MYFFITQFSFSYRFLVTKDLQDNWVEILGVNLGKGYRGDGERRVGWDPPV